MIAPKVPRVAVTRQVRVNAGQHPHKDIRIIYWRAFLWLRESF
jgi:hypothetical protein